MTDRDRRRILNFLEKQDNIYAKIENNINQLARIANAQKLLLPSLQRQLVDYLGQTVKLRKQYIKITESIYRFIAKGEAKIYSLENNFFL